jgi:L,D-transpeptidase catalytic domain
MWTMRTASGSGPKLKHTWLRLAQLLSVAPVLAIATSDFVGAASGRSSERLVESVDSRSAGEPIMAVVSLRNQRITVYDANGWILRAPVSSGQKGRETPAGIFSIIQKDAEHYSNLYDDAYMPHMQRLTWSGIALHGGPLPGYPASHGCVRMPYDFARRLFDATSLGMRVIVAPTEVAPVDIAHPALFQTRKSDLESIVAARAAEAREAASRADQARLAAVTASREAARASMAVRIAENLKLRADAQVTAADRAIAAAGSPEARQQAESAKAEAVARVAEIEPQLAAARAELQPKLEAVASSRQAALAAESARAIAEEAAHEVARELDPVSVFISRKTQRLYVRRAFQPILESPVTIQDADRPIGTHVFTAMERSGADGEMHWTVVSLRGSHADPVIERAAPGRKSAAREPEPVPSDAESAREALGRIAIPQDIVDRIAGMASPRSSLIISDEALSPETGKGTEFVVIMNGEPQGGIKFRRRGVATEVRYERSRPHWLWPFASPRASW